LELWLRQPVERGLISIGIEAAIRRFRSQKIASGRVSS
jgi:hypothetical protein